MSSKWLIMICLSFTISLLSNASAVAADTLTVRVKGMRCEECAHKVRTVVKQLPGIESMSANLERRTVTIAYDPALTCVDSIRGRLDATKRYAASDYSPADVIKRGFGLRIDDMFCKKCADKIVGRLEKIQGVDSLAPHLDKHYVFVRYDANVTCKDSIRTAVLKLGYTPVNYYSGSKVNYAYYNIPTEAATRQTVDDVLAIEAVEDVKVNPRRKSMAVTYFVENMTPEQLLAEIRKMGIEAVLPPAHECKE